MHVGDNFMEQLDAIDAESSREWIQVYTLSKFAVITNYLNNQNSPEIFAAFIIHFLLASSTQEDRGGW